MTVRVFVRLIRAALLTGLLLAAALAIARPALPVVEAAPAARPLGQTRFVGEGPNKAAVAAKYGDGHVESVCVSFPEQNISGGELLERSGLELVMSPEGAVCSIGGEGCPSDNCFCLCERLQDCQYWAFYQWQGDRFVYSQFGVMVDTVIVSNGTMHGWAWGSGDYSTGAPPPEVTFDQVCTVADTSPTGTPTVTPTATATYTPQPQPSGPAAAPQATFAAAAYSLPPRQCTTLTWSTADATTVTLEGVAVGFTGSQQVCPQVSHTYTLIATNTFGPTSRQLTIQVAGTGAPTSTPTLQPGGVTARPTAPTPSPRPIMTQPPAPLPGATQDFSRPTPDGGLVPLTPGAFDGGGVPLAPTAEVPALPVTALANAHADPVYFPAVDRDPAPPAGVGRGRTDPDAAARRARVGARDRRRPRRRQAAIRRRRAAARSRYRAVRFRPSCCPNMRPMPPLWPRCWSWAGLHCAGGAETSGWLRASRCATTARAGRSRGKRSLAPDRRGNRRNVSSRGLDGLAGGCGAAGAFYA